MPVRIKENTNYTFRGEYVNAELSTEALVREINWCTENNYRVTICEHVSPKTSTDGNYHVFISAHKIKETK